MSIEPLYKIVEIMENGKSVLQIFSEEIHWWQNDFFKTAIGSFCGGLFGFLFALILWWLSNRKEKNKLQDEKEEIVKSIISLIKHELLYNLKNLTAILPEKDIFFNDDIKSKKLILELLTMHCYEKLFNQLSLLNYNMMNSILTIYRAIESCRMYLNKEFPEKIESELTINETVEKLFTEKDGTQNKQLQRWIIVIYNNIYRLSKNYKGFKEIKEYIPPYMIEIIKNIEE